MSTEAHPTSVTAYEDGPLVIRGDFVLRSQDGTELDVDPGPLALCRCGRSGRKPLCDGTHAVVGFHAPAT